MEMDEIEKKYFSISEVAEKIGEKASLIRFWEGHFPMIKPKKGKNGARQYTKHDIEIIQAIHYLVKVKGYTLQGAKEAMKNRNKVLDQQQVIEALERVRSFLLEVKNQLPDEKKS
jgi:DNA-binding transcriptional MerR regulator